MALVTRIEVLNQHECQAGIVRQMAEQFRERFQSASGCSYADDERGIVFGRSARRLAPRLPHPR